VAVRWRVAVRVRWRALSRAFMRAKTPCEGWAKAVWAKRLGRCEAVCSRGAGRDRAVRAVLVDW